jgi:hypothetical protein
MSNQQNARVGIGCPSGKICYATEVKAEAAVQRHEADQGETMLENPPQWSSYRCTTCRTWHLTSGPRWPSWFGKRLGPRASKKSAPR